VKPSDPGAPPPPPPSAARVFASGRLQLAERYAELLATEGVVRGLIGPREGSRLWERHLVNCAVLGELVPNGASVCDVGSGAGLPGLVLAIARPDLTVTLVEPLLRRTTFLEEVVADLELEGVEVHRARAEALHGIRTFDVVTSRAVAPLARLLAWSMPLVAATGALVAMKGTSAADEILAAETTLRRMGCATPEIHSVGANLTDSPSTAIRVAWADPARVRWPRPKGSSTKKRRGRGRPDT
jgi:16S rRNA (guanine527-N7)-methyltransferase